MVKFGIRKNIQRYRCPVCKRTRSDVPQNPLGNLRVRLEKAVQVINLLCESTGIRACERLTGLNRRTILNILETAGQKSAAFSDAHVRNVKPYFVQADEMACIVQCREQNNVNNIEDIGMQFMFLAIDSYSKLIISSLIGRRTTIASAQTFQFACSRAASPVARSVIAKRLKIFALLPPSFAGISTSFGSTQHTAKHQRKRLELRNMQ